MSKSRLIPKLILLTTIATIVLSIVPSVVAVSPRDRVDKMFFSEQNIVDAGWYGWDIISTEESYFVMAIGYSEEEKDINVFQPPYKVQLFVDGEEILLLEFSWYDKEGYIMEMYGVGPIPIHWWFFYHVFEPGYFDPGPHSFITYISWRDGQGLARTIWEVPMEIPFNVV